MSEYNPSEQNRTTSANSSAVVAWIIVAILVAIFIIGWIAWGSSRSASTNYAPSTTTSAPANDGVTGNNAEPATAPNHPAPGTGATTGGAPNP